MKSVINLIKTPQGYSILEGETELNKHHHKNHKEKSHTQPKKFAQQNFTIYPYIPNKEADNHKYILIPAKSQWFNLNSVHEIQKKALPEWFKIKKGIFASMNNIKFQKHEQLYKKYRNYIIQLGKYQYVSPSRARKGLAGDVCAIIRIHKFIEKWGIINYIHTKPPNKNKPSPSLSLERPEPTQEKLDMKKRKDCFEKDKGLVNRTYNKDDLQLLKKITKKYRSVCHFCQGITGIVWFEYNETLFLKKIETAKEKDYSNVKSQSTSFDYRLTLCASCFHQGNIPVVLNISDFKKTCIVDKIQSETTNESQKKKNNEQNRIADAIEKYKFNIVKAAQNLKISPERVFSVLMTMPIQKLQKISRIQAQTEDEKEGQETLNAKFDEPINGDYPAKKGQSAVSLQEKIRQEVNNLQSQERQLYEKFLQSWLLKINAKAVNLQNWQQSVQSKFSSTNRLQKHSLAQKIRNLSKSL